MDTKNDAKKRFYHKHSKNEIARSRKWLKDINQKEGLASPDKRPWTQLDDQMILGTLKKNEENWSKHVAHMRHLKKSGGKVSDEDRFKYNTPMYRLANQLGRSYWALTSHIRHLKKRMKSKT
jgi:hypothetical protein